MVLHVPVCRSSAAELSTDQGSGAGSGLLLSLLPANRRHGSDMHRRREIFNAAHKLMQWDMIGSNMHGRKEMFNTALMLKQWDPDRQ